MKTSTPITDTIKAGHGFTVGQDFGRAKVDTPIVLAPDEYAKPGCTIGYIAADPLSSLGFLKYGNRDGKIRVHVQFQGLKSWTNPVAL